MMDRTPQGHMTRRSFVRIGAAMGGSALIAGLSGCGDAGAEQPEEAPAGTAVEGAADAGGQARGEVPATVFFARAVDQDALAAVFGAVCEALKGERIGVKLSTGEPGGNHYLQPDLIAGLVASVNGTIVECNTAYGGQRGTTESHYRVAEDHGFTAIAPFAIMDEGGSVSLPVEGGYHLNEDLVGAGFGDYDGFLVLSHFKGHTMAGFGGALKNISIGMASREGKFWIHSAGATNSHWQAAATPDFLESMADAAKAVTQACPNMVYVNVMNNLSVDCDCDSHPAEPKMADIGILASTDPVALDQACVDLVYASDDDSADLIERIESRGGQHVLEAAEALGVGSRAYELVEVSGAIPGTEAPSDDDAQPEGAGTADTAGNTGAAVVFFSATGHTAPIAEYVATALGADLFRIEAAEPYTDEDLNYNDSSSRATMEQNAGDPRPAIAGALPDLAAYRTVLIGHPIWWGRVPRIMLTLAENVDLAGKTVTTFCTSGSSDIGSSADELAAASDPSATWVHGRRFAIGTGYDEAAEWALGLAL